MLFRINGELWRLYFVSPYANILKNPDGQFTLGCTVPLWRTVFISDALCGEMLHKVLCHEMWHAEMASRGIEIPIQLEETLADIVSDHEYDTVKVTRQLHNRMCNCYGKC